MRQIPGFPNYLLTEDFEIFSLATQRNLILRLNRDGYLEVYLKPSKYHKKVRIGIHQIICLVFYGECPKGMEIRHLDGNKLNNNNDNLRYGTKLENSRDKYKHWNYSINTKGFVKKLKEEEVVIIKRKLKEGISVRKLSRDYNINRTSIRAIRDYRTWKNVHD